MDDNSQLLIIGNANVENSTKRTILTATKTALYNFCQIFRWEFGASGTLQSSELYGGDDLDSYNDIDWIVEDVKVEEGNDINIITQPKERPA